MRVTISLIAVGALIGLAYVGTQVLGLQLLFGVIVPYAAIVVFLAGVVLRVLAWARVPVPFHIPSVSGQQRSLPWIKRDPLGSPYTTREVIARMALEVLLFRSLMSNTRTTVRDGGNVVHSQSRWLWAAALAFHWSFLVILVRHTRFFMEPVPACVDRLAALDGFFQISVPTLYVSSAVLLASLGFLLARRLASPQLRYLSLANDYFPLLLLLAIALSGLTLRHFLRGDVASIKTLALGLISLHPVVVSGIHWVFYVHLFLVSTLLAYIPLSKLMHMGGVFLSPTRNLPNNSRAVRHVNPWNQPVAVHTYAEYEDEFREKMKSAGIPVERG